MNNLASIIVVEDDAVIRTVLERDGHDAFCD